MISRSKAHTQQIAKKLAKKLLRARHRTRAAIIALQGDLGAGKTTFVQGFAKGLGIKRHITSPTFLIIRRYPLESKKHTAKGDKEFKNLYHIDLYQIKKAKEILDLGFKKIVSDQKNIVVIEWPEKIIKILPKNPGWVYLKHGKKENQREIFLK